MAGKTKNRRTGGSGSVFQDSKGRWHFRKDMGTDPATGRRRPPIEATGMVKSEARARFQAKIAEWERDGRLPSKDGPKTADYFERWMEEHRAAINPTTWRNESSWMRTMNAIIGDIRLNRLTANDINGMCRRLRRTRKSKTVNTYLAVLGAMLRTAKRDGLIADDPMENVGRMPEDRYERPILDVADPAKVIEAALAEPDPAVAVFDSPDEREKWALMFELAFTTGMRPGERYGLMPYQLELHHGIPVINVCQQAKPIPAGATIPDWMEAEHLDGAIWLTKPKTAKAPADGSHSAGALGPALGAYRQMGRAVPWTGVHQSLRPSHQTGQRGEALAPRPEDGGTAVRRHLQRAALARHRTRRRRRERRGAHRHHGPHRHPHHQRVHALEGTAARQDARRRPARPPRRPVTDGDGFSSTRKSIDTPRARR